MTLCVFKECFVPVGQFSGRFSRRVRGTWVFSDTLIVSRDYEAAFAWLCLAPCVSRGVVSLVLANGVGGAVFFRVVFATLDRATYSPNPSL